MTSPSPILTERNSYIRVSSTMLYRAGEAQEVTVLHVPWGSTRGQWVRNLQNPVTAAGPAAISTSGPPLAVHCCTIWQKLGNLLCHFNSHDEIWILPVITQTSVSYFTQWILWLRPSPTTEHCFRRTPRATTTEHSKIPLILERFTYVLQREHTRV